MFAWWDVLESVTQVNAWANGLSIVFLVLTVAAGALAFTSGKRAEVLKRMQPGNRIQTVAPRVAPPAPKPQELPAPVKQSATPVPPPAAAPAVVPAAAVPAKPVEDSSQRHLTKLQKDKLISLLNSRPKGQVSVTYMLNDQESQTYFTELMGVLHATGWKAVNAGPTSLASAPKGLHFQIKNPEQEPENAKYLIHSFLEVGIKPSTELNRAVPEATLVLIVGHRP